MKHIHILISCILLSGCSDLFEYHPYDTRFSGECDINRSNIERIEQACRDKQTLRVAFIGDTHEWYSDAKDMISDINGRQNIDFVVHGGDLTDCGTAKEFVLARDMLDALNVPYVALMGNHDMLGTGDEVFYDMYGPADFSFIAGRIKFVCLNTNATEYDYMAAVPNFDYMEEQLTASADLFDRTIICMHAPPYCEQFNNNVAKAFEHYVRLFPGLMFCVYAHVHRLEVNEFYGDGVIYYSVDSAKHRNYIIITITQEGYDYEVVYY